jgi:hypothetical protein
VTHSKRETARRAARAKQRSRDRRLALALSTRRMPVRWQDTVTGQPEPVSEGADSLQLAAMGIKPQGRGRPDRRTPLERMIASRRKATPAWYRDRRRVKRAIKNARTVASAGKRSKAAPTITFVDGVAKAALRDGVKTRSLTAYVVGKAQEEDRPPKSISRARAILRALGHLPR